MLTWRSVRSAADSGTTAEDSLHVMETVGSKTQLTTAILLTSKSLSI